MKGKLTLIPTPIDEDNSLEPVAQKLLLTAFEQAREKSIFVVEDLKPGRRRWLRFGLPREAVEDLVLYNEHTWREESESLLQKLRGGHQVFLMSDGGLPAFCDPGRHLVDRCHDEGIEVAATPFCNSISLAVALSGFDHSRFFFAGFLPVEKDDRAKELNDLLNRNETIVLMDTPYRLKRLLEELDAAMRVSDQQRNCFLALDLNRPEQELLRGKCSDMLKKIVNFKREFILLLAAKNS